MGFGEPRIDENAWLRDRDDLRVRAHLETETAHAEATLDASLRARLYAEMRGRIKEDDSSVPSREGPWLYYSRTETGDEYPRHCRRLEQGGEEEVYLDENELAADHEYFELASLAVSDDHRLCAYAVDVVGDEIHRIQILDLDTGRLLDDDLRGCGTSLAWGRDQAGAPTTLFYTRLDEAHRPWQVWRHALGQEQSTDVAVHEEPSGEFYLSVYSTRSKAFVVLSADSQVTSEMYLIPSDQPVSAPVLVAERQQGVEYGLCHRNDELFVLTNEDATNFKVMRGSSQSGTDPATWREFIPHQDAVMIEGIECFARHLVVWERFEGLPRVRVIALDTSGDAAQHLIEFPDPTYAIWSGANPEFDAHTLRFGYTSLTTPASIYDYDLDARTRALRKRQEIVGGHDPKQYASARVWATGHDGERVPISLVWLGSQAAPPEARPLVLYGYGAYGANSDPSFSSTRLSLLDRGVVWAIAHVRGGSELGRRWYDMGKLAHKHNTFDDFIACAEHLIEAGWTSADQLAATGASAGGLLIGAVANARPELFTAMVADVPFVDVLNTMEDPELPLTVLEREEWGDPSQAQGYGWIRGYSPYDNVCSQGYPPMLVLAGYNDPRVGYWEPAKWVARLRARKTDRNEILLWTNMGAGHGGASGRFEFLHELALEHAFLIEQLRLPHDILK